MNEIDKYLAIIGAVVISIYAMLTLPNALAIGVITAVVTGIFALAGTGKDGDKGGTV